MTLQNRCSPLGELVADPARGLVFGNRGCLHDRRGRIVRPFSGRRWIACRLEFRGWLRRPLLQPGRYTELFFLDEATALAAGHRPCALCRRADYDRFLAFWRSLHGGPVGAETIDARLHLERVHPATRERRLHELPLAPLPDGAFVLRGGVPALVLGSALLRWTPGGYGEPVERPADELARVITPPTLLELLRAGWDPLVPLLHPSAGTATPPG